MPLSYCLSVYKIIYQFLLFTSIPYTSLSNSLFVYLSLYLSICLFIQYPCLPSRPLVASFATPLATVCVRTTHLCSALLSLLFLTYTAPPTLWHQIMLLLPMQSQLNFITLFKKTLVG